MTRRYSLWIPLALLAAFLLVFPFFKGLLIVTSHQYVGPLYGAMLFVFLAYAIFAALNWNNRLSLRGPAGLLSLAVFLLPLSFLVASFGAASRYGAILAFFLYMMYAFLFVMGSQLSALPSGREGLVGAVGLSGFVIVVFGFLNYFGDASLWGLIRYRNADGSFSDIYPLASEYGASGLRLTSVFQYANSYAAFLLGILFLALMWIVHRRWNWMTALASLLPVPVLLSFLLTQSRGAYLAFPVVALLFLFILKVENQIRFVLCLVSALAFALFLYGPVYDIGLLAAQSGFSPGAAAKGWTLLILSSVAYAAFIFLMDRYLREPLDKLARKASTFRGSRFWLPAAGVLSGALAAFLLFAMPGALKWLPDALEQRLASINLSQHSLLERNTFYADIFQIVRDYPVFGAGGGAWAAMYKSIQNNPYVSRDAHSFYLQYLAETGVFGFVLLLAFLGFILFGFFRLVFSRDSEPDGALIALAGPVFSLAVHSAIDLNMTFAFLASLFFLCLGGIASGVPLRFLEKPGANITLKKNSRGMNKRNKTLSGSFLAVTVLVSIVLSVVNIQRLSGSVAYAEAIDLAESGEVPYSEIDLKLQEAIRSDPDNPVYVIQRAQFLVNGYEQTGYATYANLAENELNRLMRKEPFNLEVYRLKSRLLAAQGRTDERLALLDRAVDLFPWEVEFYEDAIALRHELGLAAEAGGNPDGKRQHWQAILRLYDKVQANIRRLEMLPSGQLQGKPFQLSSRSLEIVQMVQEELK